ncbi:MAG: M14 family metallopeptidase [Pseudomonadota bacterium]
MTHPLADIANEYPIELTPPDITPYAAGTHGIPYVHTFDSGVAGPHVAISAVVHGNEPCGAVALDTFLKEGLRPERGRLSFAFVNVAAYAAFDPEDPNASRWVDEDFNRLWSPETLEGPRDSVELARAREIRPWLETVDLLLDIHTMQHKTAPLMMAGPAEKGLALAAEVGIPDIVVADEGHAAGPRMRDYAPFVDPASKRNALLVECGQHWEAMAGTYAIETALRFLAATGAIEQDTIADRLTIPAAPQRRLRITDRVTVQTDDFAFTERFVGLDHIAKAGTVIATDGGAPVRTPYDDCILIMPSKRLWKGLTAVRLGRFIDG